MAVDFTQPVLSMPDGSYVVSMSNGYPYNVLATDPFWNDVQAWLAVGNTTQPYVPPAPIPPDPKIAAQATLQTLIPQIINTIMVGPSAPLAFSAQWLAAWKAAGNGG